jgi:hypothetical protein
VCIEYKVKSCWVLVMHKVVLCMVEVVVVYDLLCLSWCQ